MQIVVKLDQILANIGQLEVARSDPRANNLAEYLALIKRGTCFLPYLTKQGLAFAPSRFIGYIGNSFAKHAANSARDGRLTNSAINEILGQPPITDATLETEYLQFCARIGISPSRTGTFGVQRKYWITADVCEWLDSFEVAEVLGSPQLTATEKEQIVKARVGQGAFREALLKFWNGRCCLTGCNVDPVLRASHIKPWRVSTNSERLDQYNGLLLTANIDALFDRGFITFGDDGSIIRSREISNQVLKLIGCDSDSKIAIEPGHSPFLAYHRAEIFRSI